MLPCISVTVSYKFVYLMYCYVVIKWLIFVDLFIINMTASSDFVILFQSYAGKDCIDVVSTNNGSCMYFERLQLGDIQGLLFDKIAKKRRCPSSLHKGGVAGEYCQIYPNCSISFLIWLHQFTPTPSKNPDLLMEIAPLSTGKLSSG